MFPQHKESVINHRISIEYIPYDTQVIITVMHLWNIVTHVTGSHKQAYASFMRTPRFKNTTDSKSPIYKTAKNPTK